MPLGKDYTIESQLTGKEVLLPVRRNPSLAYPSTLIIDHGRNPNRRIPDVPHQHQVHSSRPYPRHVQNARAAGPQARDIDRDDPGNAAQVCVAYRLVVIVQDLTDMQGPTLE